MTDKEFDEVKALNWQHFIARFSIITMFSGDKITLFMRDAEKQFTKDQIKEAVLLLSRELQPMVNRPVVFDFTTPPPY